MHSELEQIKNIVKKAEKIVFFGGAGVSTASGIPDFRGSRGLYTVEAKYGYSPEEILSRSFLYENTDTFFEYYRDNMLYPYARPNGAHAALARLEADGKLLATVTQNIDGLHQAAGAKRVIELHGSVHRNYCVDCGEEYDLPYILSSDAVPSCKACGGLVRPNVVLYGEPLSSSEFYEAEKAIMDADVLIVGGTSLTVNPAASLVASYDGEHLIIINKSPTPYDAYAEFVIRDSVEDVLEYVTD